MIRAGDRGVVVAALQTALKDLGFYSGPSDGHFGELTKVAVWYLQTEYGVADVAAGVVGPATVDCLEQMGCGQLIADA